MLQTRLALRLPRKLAYTAIRVAVAGTLACTSPAPTADASADAAADEGNSGQPIGYCTASGQVDAAACPGSVTSASDCPADAGCVLIGFG